jgi:hypothetical protein
LSFRGGNVAGEVQVRSRFILPPYYKPRYAQPLLITRETLDSIDAVAVGIRRVYSAPGEYARLKRGIMGAWLSGMEARYGDARLHQFVRATEAVIKPRIGETKRQFVHRAMLFIGNTEDNRALLGQLFDLRSAAEHMNDFEAVLQDVPAGDRERFGWRRSYEAELLTGRIYCRLMSTPRLLEIFRDDTQIEAFWVLADNERRAQWGPSFDLRTLANERHTLEPEPSASPMQVI